MRAAERVLDVVLYGTGYAAAAAVTSALVRSDSVTALEAQFDMLRVPSCTALPGYEQVTPLFGAKTE